MTRRKRSEFTGRHSSPWTPRPTLQRPPSSEENGTSWHVKLSVLGCLVAMALILWLVVVYVAWTIWRSIA